MSVDGRIEGERAFHDDRYRNELRESQDKFYEGLQDSEGRFQEFVDQFHAGDRVLELGCGVNSRAFSLAARGVEVVGIDVSPVAVEIAQSEASCRGLDGASFREMNAEVLDFPAGSFDGVIGTAGLHHLDVVCAYREMARVLRPGGRAVFIEPLGHNPLINAYRRRTPHNRTQFEHPLRCEDFTLSYSYFENVHVETFHLFAIVTSPIAKRPWGRPVHAAVSWVDRQLLKRPSRLRWHAWIAVVEFRGPR
ncbi:MAG: methyltransferase domain-containing protein [Actinobacteria bacterium]|nr:methyltransferase domain-containing protein [Actinomycetota bacterium]